MIFAQKWKEKIESKHNKEQIIISVCKLTKFHRMPGEKKKKTVNSSRELMCDIVAKLNGFLVLMLLSAVTNKKIVFFLSFNN